MSLEQYWEITEQARAAAVAGEWERALERYAQAAQTAIRTGDRKLADRALCIRCGIAAEIGDAQAQIPALQEVLLRSSDAEIRSLAAFYSAQAFYLESRFTRAEKLATQALELAKVAHERNVAAGAANLLGNIALISSRFPEAESMFASALESLQASSDYARLMEAQVRDNLGYTLICTSHIRNGISECERALTAMREFKSAPYIHQVLQDLCFGHVLLGEFETARRFGDEGLVLALSLTDDLVTRNLFFLLSEIAINQGQKLIARRYLAELTRFYPEAPQPEELLELFLATDLVSVVNLRG